MPLMFKFAPVVVLGGGVLLISGIRAQHVMPPVHPMSAVHVTLADYSFTDVIVDSLERKVAGMSDYTMREFRRDSTSFFSVYVGYYDRQVQGKTIHSPKNCLPGAGWDVLTSERVPFPAAGVAGTVNRVLLSNKGFQALVFYWYQGRGRIESNEYRVKWDLLRDAARFGRTEEALVRIVVPIGAESLASGKSHAEVDRAEQLARSVAVQLAPAVYSVLPGAP